MSSHNEDYPFQPVTDERTTAIRISSEAISYLQGNLLTVIDASYGDTEQRKAVKDLVNNQLWQWGSRWQRGFNREQWERNQALATPAASKGIATKLGKKR